jgi:hypothetical protein
VVGKPAGLLDWQAGETKPVLHAPLSIHLPFSTHFLLLFKIARQRPVPTSAYWLIPS